MTESQPSVGLRLLSALGVLFVLAILLVQIYISVGLWLGSTLYGALLTNFLIGSIYLVWLSATGSSPFTLMRPVKSKWHLPGVMVLVCVIAAATTSRLIIPGAESIRSSHIVVTVLLVPIAEELVFRGMIGTRLQQKLGIWTGAYLSALFFAWIHSMPTLETLADGTSGIFLGPLLLGITCEFLVFQSKGSLLAAISFHMICNATGPIFAWIDGRWLKWLKLLYL
jgi:membrane protease YdiL (CAAX protease family)